MNKVISMFGLGSTGLNQSASALMPITEQIVTLHKEIEYQALGGRFISLNLQNLHDCQKQKRMDVSQKNKQQERIKSPKIRTLKEIIKAVEQEYQIPENLLLSIAKVETRVRPYAINYNGRGVFFRNINDAVAFAENLVRNGRTNFSVGCFQLHYQSHARRFKTLKHMFEPEHNIRYAAKLLTRLYRTCGYSWEYAVKRYHSCYEISNCIYYSKIVNNLGRCV